MVRNEQIASLQMIRATRDNARRNRRVERPDSRRPA